MGIIHLYEQPSSRCLSGCDRVEVIRQESVAAYVSFLFVYVVVVVVVIVVAAVAVAIESRGRRRLRRRRSRRCYYYYYSAVAAAVGFFCFFRCRLLRGSCVYLFFIIFWLVDR